MSTNQLAEERIEQSKVGGKENPTEHSTEQGNGEWTLPALNQDGNFYLQTRPSATMPAVNPTTTTA